MNDEHRPPEQPHEPADVEHTQPYGSAHGEPHGQPYGQPYGEPYGQPYGEPYGQESGQAYGEAYGQEPRTQSVPQPAWGTYPPPPREPAAPRPRVPLWVWPAVAVLALVLGVLGGGIGAVVVDRIADAAGRVEGGLGDVETQEQPPLPADNGSVAAVARELLPSTVQILAEFDGEERGATGSGFVLDRQGHIVTNNHVVASAAEDDGTIEVLDHRGRTYAAEVVGRSAVYDLAILQVDGRPDLRPAALGASQVLNVGDQVVAFGAPLGLSQTVTSGIVSAKDRPVTTGDDESGSSYINAVQTDAAINPGNSGGPLVNLAGEVVGVNSAIATTGGFGGEGGNIGVGFSIPIEQVRVTSDQILRTGEAQYPVIGAEVRVAGTDVDGARITQVMPDTPAEAAGLDEDDLVVALDGNRVTDGISLIVAIRTYQPGDTLELTVRRGGEEQQVEVTLDGKVG